MTLSKSQELVTLKCEVPPGTAMWSENQCLGMLGGATMVAR